VAGLAVTSSVVGHRPTTQLVQQNRHVGHFQCVTAALGYKHGAVGWGDHKIKVPIAVVTRYAVKQGTEGCGTGQGCLG
jgi:hypothetical protein